MIGLKLLHLIYPSMFNVEGDKKRFRSESQMGIKLSDLYDFSTKIDLKDGVY